MYLRRFLSTLPVLALFRIAAACSDQQNDPFPTIPPNQEVVDGGVVPRGTCTVAKAGDSGKVITGGTLLLPAGPVPGELFVSADGVIRCADASCASADGYATATKIECTNVVVSPGLINPHDHIPYAGNPPQGHGQERYEQRNDWRQGARGHSKISASSSNKDVPNTTEAAELRFVMSGVTAAASAGGTKGLIRNVDANGMLEDGLQMPITNSQTFPLKDTSFKDAPTTCDGWPDRDTASFVASQSDYLPHISEGINESAHAEIQCLSDSFPGLSDEAHDVLQPQTAVIHGVAVGPTEAAIYRKNRSILVWSPRSNVDLYGNTASVAMYASAGVPIALGTDWLPSGSMNMARELRCADDLNTSYFAKALTDRQLWEAVTINAAFAVGAGRSLGMLRPGFLGDVAVFNAAGKDPYRAVIEASIEDTVLVMRSGMDLYGDADLVKNDGGGDCETLTVCKYRKRACVQKDLGTLALSDLMTVGDALYPLYFCKSDAVRDEPSCAPFRGPTADHPEVSTYSGITATDKDGDGIPDKQDNCPTVFNPVRPMDDGVQADTDGDGIGDACDKCALVGGQSCTVPDADDFDDDGLPNWADNCPDQANPDQADVDQDGKGTVCDLDPAGNPCDSIPNPGGAACPQVVTIQKLRRLGDPGHPTSGKTRAAITGVYVTAVKTAGQGAQGFFIQDGTAQYSGIFVAQDAPTVQVGNRIDIVGDYAEVSSVSQLANVVVKVVDPGTTLPFGPVVVDPAVIADATGAYAAGEPWESMLVVVNGPIAISNMNPDAPDDHDEFAVGAMGLRVDDYLDDPLDNLDPVGTTFRSITGICGYSFDQRKLWPRTDADIPKQ